MAQKQNISTDLYDLLATRNADPEVTDNQGQASAPDEGTVFTFDYISATGRDYGTAVLVITDEHELNIFFGDNLGKTMEEPDKTEWFEFLRQLAKFATRNNFHTFAPRNINQLKHTMAGMAAIREGLFEGYYGTRRVSYAGAPTEARLMIKHDRTLGENDARHRHVAAVFIETQDDERFRLPFKNMTAARAMLEHVRQGGRPYDVRGCHIAEMVLELAVLSRFRRANAGRVMEGETATLVEQAGLYYQQMRQDLRGLGHARGYTRYFESWHPAHVSDTENLVENIKQLFIETTLDQRIEQALPVLAKIKERTMREADIFEAWAHRLTEGTWTLPDTPEQKNRLQELLSQPLELGADAINATELLNDVVGDDQLFDLLQAAAAADPDASAWDIPAVMQRLQDLGVDTTVADADVAAEEPAAAMEADNVATFQEGQCNHTMEGESCPRHGEAECSMREDEFDDAMKDYEMRGGKIQQEPGRMPRLSTRLRRQGSHHIGTAAARPTKGRITGQGANTGTSSNKPVVTAEGLQSGEYHIATVTLDDGTTKRVRITSDEGYRDKIHKHFARQGQEVTDIQVDFAVRTNENSPGSAVINRGGHNRLRSKQDYLDKRDVLMQLLNNTGTDADTRSKAKQRLLDLEQAARLAGIVAEQGNADDHKPRFTGVPARNPDPSEVQSHGTLPPAPGRPSFTDKPGDRPSLDALDRLKTLAFTKTR